MAYGSEHIPVTGEEEKTKVELDPEVVKPEKEVKKESLKFKNKEEKYEDGKKEKTEVEVQLKCSSVRKEKTRGIEDEKEKALKSDGRTDKKMKEEEEDSEREGKKKKEKKKEGKHKNKDEATDEKEEEKEAKR